MARVTQFKNQDIAAALRHEASNLPEYRAIALRRAARIIEVDPVECAVRGGAPNAKYIGPGVKRRVAVMLSMASAAHQHSPEDDMLALARELACATKHGRDDGGDIARELQAMIDEYYHSQVTIPGDVYRALDEWARR